MDKKTYYDKMREQVRDWATKIDELIVKAEKTSGEKKIEYQEEIRKLKEKKTDAEVKLKELQASGEEKWEEIKGSLDQLSTDVRGAFNKFLYGEGGKKE
jgi:predicted  nucleic acid-binding Zn-ribbon protein